MRIAVIGAGWYGCHIARHLIKAGHSVVIFERDGIFSGASGNNQDRVHLGFHYPRSAKTRDEIQACYIQFIREYPTLPVTDNLYAIATDRSLIDYRTYLTICKGSGMGLGYTEVDPSQFGLRGVEGAIRTTERVVDTAAVKRQFEEELEDFIRYEKENFRI